MSNWIDPVAPLKTFPPVVVYTVTNGPGSPTAPVEPVCPV